VSTLIILKLTVTPLLVAAMSLVARRFGPTIGGLILGLPWMTAPVQFFFALERGDAYLAETARGALLAVPPMAVFAVVYAGLARYCRWPVCLVCAAVAFAGSGWQLSQLEAPAIVVAAMGVAALFTGRWLIARPGSTTNRAMPWWDILARMLATAVLVGFITLSADRLGPTLSGVASSYPVILTVVGSFTLSRWGYDAMLALLRSVQLSLLGFVTFFTVVATFVQDIGLLPAYAAATIAGLCVNGSLLLVNSRLSPAAPPVTSDRR
jgi:hypothetical protein